MLERIEAVDRQVVAEARESLARTPEQLAVLKKAGVVDAGAKGFVSMLEGVLFFVEGVSIAVSTEAEAATDAPEAEAAPEVEAPAEAKDEAPEEDVEKAEAAPAEEPAADESEAEPAAEEAAPAESEEAPAKK